MTNINGDVKRYINLLKDTTEKKKLLNSFKMIKTHNFTLLYARRLSSYEVILQDKNKVEIGYFTISLNNRFTMMMSITVDDEYMGGKLRKTGLSRLLICSLLFCLKDDTFRKDQLLFIDVDASYSNGKSFWENIGMITCRFDEVSRGGIRKTNLDGSGCEKVITYTNLCKWVFGVPMGNNQVVVSPFFKI